jgi:hypothetical protein
MTLGPYGLGWPLQSTPHQGNLISGCAVHIPGSTVECTLLHLQLSNRQAY